MPEPDETGPGSAEQTADRVADLLTRQDPTAAWGVLDALPMPALLEALNVLDQRGVLAVLVGVPNASPRIYAALAVRELAKVDARRLDGNALAQLSRAGEALDRLRPWDRAAAYDYVLTQRGVAPELGHTLAGLIGLEGESVRANEPVIADEPTASSAVGPPIRPLPYTPGRQPRWLYLGNQAHKAIAAYYQAVNFQDRVLSNSVPISTILAAFGRLGHAPTPSALRAWELRSRPDIVNLTQLHIYEIKPAHSQLLASRIVRIYMARFGRAGIALGLGPPEAPGTRGVVPGPGGWYVFWSPEPGVIVYQYRTGPMAPVPDADRVPVPLGGRAPSRQPAPEREGLRFELEPPGPEVVPVVVGAGLLMLMAALAVATSG